MTETDICNRALALLGHDRPIEDFDGMTDGAYNDQSTEAVRCRAFYGAAVRNCLAEHDWDFAAEERPVGATSPDPYGWVRLQVPLRFAAKRLKAIDAARAMRRSSSG